VAQDAIITEIDCGTKESKIVRKENALGIEVPISKNIRGRVIAEDIVVNGEVLFKKNHLITKDDAVLIENAGITEAKVFSPLMCQSLHGICQKCYGLDMGRNKKVDLGEAVGIVPSMPVVSPVSTLRKVFLELKKSSNVVCLRIQLLLLMKMVLLLVFVMKEKKKLFFFLLMMMEQRVIRVESRLSTLYHIAVNQL
jgi:hypothetical protein